MNLRSKRGAALLQVLIITAILAGMSAMILRLALSRTITSRQTRHTVNAQAVIEACMAEVNTLWAAKTPVAYERDLAACQMCAPGTGDCVNTDNAHKKHTCTGVKLFDGGPTYTVRAEMDSSGLSEPPCKITYTITNATGDARQTL